MFFLSWLSIALLVNFFEVQNVMDLLCDQSAANHYDFNTDKVCNSLRIPVLIDTCAMRRKNYPGTLDTIKYPSDQLQIHQNKLTGFIDRKPVLIA